MFFQTTTQIVQDYFGGATYFIVYWWNGSLWRGVSRVGAPDAHHTLRRQGDAWRVAACIVIAQLFASGRVEPRLRVRLQQLLVALSAVGPGVSVMNSQDLRRNTEYHNYSEATPQIQ
eukprot:1693536-Amphidinium_carterae.3